MMEMTVNEIKRNYDNAKNKSKQVRILADLNYCSTDDIKAILGMGQKDTKSPHTDTKTENMRNWLEQKLNSLNDEIKDREEQYRNYSVALLVLGEFEENKT